MWLKALRSEYQQCHGRLKNEDGFCCLGVLTDLYAKEHSKDWKYHKQFETYRVNGEAAVLSQEVKDWAGLQSNNPSVLVDSHTLALTECNDQLRLTFAQIADLIEEQL